VSNSTFSDAPATGNDGVLISATGTANITATLTGSSLLRNRANGLEASTLGAGTLDITVSGGTITGNNIGVAVSHNSTGGFSFDISGNTITGTASSASGVSVSSGSAATAGTAIAGTISNNTIDNANSSIGPGLRISAQGASAMRVGVDGNTISNIQNNRGIEAIASAGSGSLDATISSNTVTVGGAFAAEAIYVQSGALTSDTNAVCADISGNTATSPGPDIRVRQRFTSTTLRLPGYLGPGTSDIAVQTFLTAQNPIADATASHQSAAGFGGGGPCAAP
jgi:hypothetical protein